MRIGAWDKVELDTQEPRTPSSLHTTTQTLERRSVHPLMLADLTDSYRGSSTLSSGLDR